MITNRPQFEPFTFSSVPREANLPSLGSIRLTRLMDYDTLVHGFTTFNSNDLRVAAQFYCYTIQMFDSRSMFKLMDDPISSGTFESTAASGGFELPSPWFVPKGTGISIELNNRFCSAVSVSPQICLLCEVNPPNINYSKQPYLYSYFMNLGYADPRAYNLGGIIRAEDANNFRANSGTGGIGRSTSETQVKSRLDSDFELVSIILDDQTLQSYPATDVWPSVSLQISSVATGRKLFNDMTISRNVGGYRLGQHFPSVASEYAASDQINAIPYVLPEPVIFKAGDQIKVDMALSFSWLLGRTNAVSASNIGAQVHSGQQDRLNLLLIGNKLNASGG